MILVVEDDPTLQKVLAPQIQSLGKTPTIAEDAETALQKLSCERYCMILMDIGLPGMSGIEAVKLIRQMEIANAATRTPIIAVTAGATKNDCLGAGMDEYVSKPLMVNTVKDLLEKWCPGGCTENQESCDKRQ